jgi:BolA family transcriptional regulator, general stress-responsive regulator
VSEDVGARRKEEITAALTAALEPLSLVVEDESHLHRGHAGAKDGRGHFRVHIVSAHFTGKSRLERHRLLYRALGEALEREIHALAIHASTPEEHRAQP